jgi:hypothetical protein
VHRGTEFSGLCDGALGTLGHGLTSGTQLASNLGWRAMMRWPWVTRC